MIFEGFLNFGHKIDNFGDMVIKVTENVQLGGKSQINLVLSKILIFGQVMGKTVSKIPIIPYMDIRLLRFMAITQLFLDQSV